MMGSRAGQCRQTSRGSAVAAEGISPIVMARRRWIASRRGNAIVGIQQPRLRRRRSAHACELSENSSAAYQQKSHESSLTGGGLSPSHTSLGRWPLYGTLPAEFCTQYHVWQTFMSHW
jgi:hypothetical protein